MTPISPSSARSADLRRRRTSKTVSVRVTGDFVAEPDEAVVLVCSAPAAGGAGG